MRILVTGGRSFADRELVYLALQYFHHHPQHPGDEMVLIHGGANGADYLAHQVANVLGWKVETFEADWGTHGKKAGPLRNQRMLELGKPDLVVAFEGGRGTADMRERAFLAGIKIVYPARADDGKLWFMTVGTVG